MLIPLAQLQADRKKLQVRQHHLFSMPNYGDPDYWDKRYAKTGVDGSFDWLESYDTLKDLLA